MIRLILRIGAVAAGVVLAGGALAAPALADGAYNAAVAGHSSGSALVNLAPSSAQTVDVVNLPGGVGLYGINCRVPADPRQAPTLCDSSPGSQYYLTATSAARASASFPLKVNAEFFGTNPNPTAGPALGQSVDCRADTGNPRATTCALYVMGAGKDSANPAYVRFFPEAFSAVKANRKNDAATITYDGTVLAKSAKPKLSASRPGSFTVTTASGLAAYMTGDKCTVQDEKITAGQSNGACVVRLTTTGGKNFKPLVQVQVFKLTK
jgi:hypothetical protein